MARDIFHSNLIPRFLFIKASFLSLNFLKLGRLSRERVNCVALVLASN